MKIDFDDIKIKNNLLCEASSFKLDKHGIYTICGDNGTGKTLLLRTLFINSEADGAYIPQSNNRIINNIDVVENVILFDEAKRDAAIGLLKTFDIDYLIGRKIKKLSGGEKRLICLIRGILSDGELLFIDEPTNDLDIDKVEKLLEVLKKLRAEKYIVMVTHDDRIMAISDTLFILKNKKITSKEAFNKEERDEVTLKTETKIVKNANRVKKLLNKIVKDKWYKYVIALIYMFLFVINILTTKVTPVEEQSIKNNIAELYYLNSLFGGIYGNGSLRGDVFLWYTNESKSYFDLMQKLDKVKFMYPTYCLQNLNDTTEMGENTVLL